MAKTGHRFTAEEWFGRRLCRFWYTAEKQDSGLWNIHIFADYIETVDLEEVNERLLFDQLTTHYTMWHVAMCERFPDEEKV